VGTFGVNIWSQTTYGWGQVVTPHTINQGVTRMYVPKNGVVNAPASALTIFSDPYGTKDCIVMEQTLETGNGRVLVFGDWDGFSQVYFPSYPENQTVAANIVDWALRTSTISGYVQLAGYAGSPIGKPVKLSLYREGRLVKAVDTVLGPSGEYSVSVHRSGTYDLVLKPQGYLSARQVGLSLTYGYNTVDWQVPYIGDVNGDNAVDIRDLNPILIHFGAPGPHPCDVNGDGTVGLDDASAVLINFARFGQ